LPTPKSDTSRSPVSAGVSNFQTVRAAVILGSYFISKLQNY